MSTQGLLLEELLFSLESLSFSPYNKLMPFLTYLFFLIINSVAFSATIAIIDTGFDLDHEFLKPKILKQETDEEAINPSLKNYSDWRFHDNSHLKEPVIKDKTLLQEILTYRNLRAKGHREGLSLNEFEWFKNKSADNEFMGHVKKFKKHSHGTFVAGIALREGENINLFPIRGLNLPSPVVAIEAKSASGESSIKSKTPEEKFKEEITNSENRVVKKLSKICHYLAQRGIDVVNASYGITYKNITTKFREKYKDLTGIDIEEPKLQEIVARYFDNIESRTSKVISKFPKMLFVFSAGNSGIDNDLYPHYPSKIRLPNTLSVGAMNGDYLATFSNYGLQHVDIGAPGVAIPSLVPKAYSLDGQSLYSPSSGTSMAAPYVSNLAAQILNINNKLGPSDIKKIIMETGDEKEHLKMKLVSGSLVNNQRALKAALLTKDIELNQAIALAKSGLIPMEDSVSMGQPPATSPALLEEKVMNAIPKDISPQEIEEIQTTSEESLPILNPEKDKLDNSIQLPSTDSAAQLKSAGPIPSNQSGAQSPLPSEEKRSSSSQVEPIQAPAQTPETLPSSP